MNRKPTTAGLTAGAAAAALGALGGAVRSEAKAEAARRNGAKGGRPRKARPADPRPADAKAWASVLRGLGELAERARGPEALGLNPDDSNDRREWKTVQAAIAWIRELEAGR